MSFAWLNELMQFLGKWFPRLVLVKAGHQGVKFGRRGRTLILAAGLHWYWPMVSDVTVVSLRERTNEISAQLLGSEAIAVVVKWRVRCAMTMLLRFNDVFAQLDDRTQAHLGRAYGANAESSDISAGILAGMKEEFDANGVDILAVDVIQRGWCLPLKNIADWAQHAKAELA